MLSEDPLRLRVTPLDPAVRAQQFYTAWVKRTDWRAMGRVVAEFRTDFPVTIDQHNCRVDVPRTTRRTEDYHPRRADSIPEPACLVRVEPEPVTVTGTIDSSEEGSHLLRLGLVDETHWLEGETSSFDSWPC